MSERRRGVEEQGRMLQERVRAIEQQRTSRENELRVLEGSEAFCASVRGSLEEPSFEVKQKVLQLVVDQVVVEDSRVVIQHIIPTGPVRLQTEQQQLTTPVDNSLADTLDIVTVHDPTHPLYGKRFLVASRPTRPDAQGTHLLVCLRATVQLRLPLRVTLPMSTEQTVTKLTPDAVAELIA